MRRLIVLAFLGALGCAHTDIPEPFAARAIVPPKGGGEVELGVVVDPSAPLPVLPSLGLSVGLTEHLSYVFPAALVYGGALDDSWELAVEAGILEFGVDRDVAIERSDDPRRSTLNLQGGFVTPGLGLFARFRPDPRLSLRLDALGGPSVFSFVRTAFSFKQGFSLVLDLGSTFAASLGLFAAERTALVDTVRVQYGVDLGLPLVHGSGVDFGAHLSVFRDEGAVHALGYLVVGFRF